MLVKGGPVNNTSQAHLAVCNYIRMYIYKRICLFYFIFYISHVNILTLYRHGNKYSAGKLEIAVVIVMLFDESVVFFFNFNSQTQIVSETYCIHSPFVGDLETKASVCYQMTFIENPSPHLLTEISQTSTEYKTWISNTYITTYICHQHIFA